MPQSKPGLLVTAALLASIAFSPVAWAANGADSKMAATTTDKMAGGKAANATPQGVKRISANKMKIYKDAIAAAKIKNAPAKEQINTLHQQIKDIIVAPTFDKAAFSTKNAQIETLNAQMRKNTTDAMATALTQFTPEERQALAHSARITGKHGNKKDRNGKKGNGKAARKKS